MTAQLFTKDEIDSSIANLARSIDEWIFSFQNRIGNDLVLLGLLNGGVYLTVDLSRKIHCSHQLDFISVSTYDGQEKIGPIIDKYPKIDLAGKTVLLIDDIVDSGETMRKVVEWIHTQNPGCLKIVSLFEREGQNKVHVDFNNLIIKKGLWLVGRGMDGESGCYRSLEGVYCET